MSSTNKQQYRKKKNIILGTAIIIIACIILFFIIKHFYKPAAVHNPPILYAAGVIDINKVIKVHPRYEEFLKLQSERVSLESKIDALSGNMNDLAKTFNSRDKVVNESFLNFTQQRENMRNHIAYKVLQNKMTDKEKELRQQVAGQKSADIKKISDNYKTDIFNCTLKLDNADNLRLTYDQIIEIKTQLTALKKEQAEKIHTVNMKYEMYIKNQLDAYYAEQIKQFRAKLAAENDNDRQLADKKLLEFKAKRDEILNQQAAQMNTQKKDILKVQHDLMNKNDEINALKETMINDIRVKVAKIAVNDHLNIVFINQDSLDDEAIESMDDYLKRQVVKGASTQDITDAVVKEFRNAD
ncbi:coiled-coil domain-containing protein [Pectinatus sottacetonis]|uniref:hypothetical protein n=1 Tax=Pectinatus sottacetonis TaxID=1002795 RepID=UPI0018C66E0A|nr:hypothetical protein [Pectinatus sottacetonis]